MRTLFLTQVLPYPPDSGPKVKTWNVIKYLARDHAITLVSFTRGDQSADVAQLLRYCEAVHTVPIERGLMPDGLAMARSLASGHPWMMLRDHRSAMAQLVDRLARASHFDIAHADQLNMAQYALRVSARRVLDAHNALWTLYRRLADTMPHGPKRWMLERDWRLLRAYEGRMVRLFDAVLAVSDEDRAALLDAADARREISVIPIAVDTDEVVPIARRADADHILHVGTMYWPPNIDGIRWFIDEVLPLIRTQRPGVVVDLVGARPPEWLVQLATRDPSIRVHGYVPDLTPYLETAGAFVVPLRAGGGMRVKILNAMAQGIPMVSTRLGAEGIRVEHEKHILLADAPEAFAQATLRLLSSPQYGATLAAAARRLVEECYDATAVGRHISDVYARLVMANAVPLRTATGGVH
jgi:glycosyltransferase involved in cell wall biosynthesis